jgi:hypothetical protein
LAALVLVLLQSLIMAKRQVMVVARFGARFGMRESFRVTLESLFFSQTFVSFLGGDALRIWRIRRLGLPLTDATSAVILDRLTGIVVNHALLLVSLPWLLVTITDGSVRFVLILLALAGVGGFGLILLLGLLRGRQGFLHRLRARIPSRRLMTVFVEASTVGRHFFTQYSQLSRLLLINIVISGANGVIFCVILRGMGVNFSLALGCALLVPAVLEIAMLPISIAGWGIREGAAVVAFGSVGLPAHQAIGSSVAFGLTIAAVGMLGGLMWLSDRRTMTEIQRVQESSSP